jgi:hypothetical protein
MDPAIKITMIAIADHMNAVDECFVTPDTIHAETGLALSTVALHIATADRLGILRRWFADGRASKMTAIRWDVLAALDATRQTRRGGARLRTSDPQASEHRTLLLSEHRRDPLRTSERPPPNIGETPSEHRTLSTHEATNEAISEAPMSVGGDPDLSEPSCPRWALPSSAKPTGKPLTADEAALYAAWRHAHPTGRASPTPSNRKALPIILAECDGLETAGVYVAWVATSGDEAALRLRAKAPWPDGTIVRRDDLESLSRHIPSRLPAALAWDARGRTDLRPTTRGPAVRTPAPTNKMAAAAAERLAILQEFHDRPGAEPTFTTARIEAT